MHAVGDLQSGKQRRALGVLQIAGVVGGTQRGKGPDHGSKSRAHEKVIGGHRLHLFAAQAANSLSAFSQRTAFMNVST